MDNLEKYSITEAVAISGLLDPVERTKAIRRVEDGDASILYISPESLRSVTIERLLLKRTITRFVIDEAHCLSAWGQDFRVDYLYIGKFIKSLQEKKGLPEKIAVSCFTATAKQKVIEDIRKYFEDELGLHLELFRADITRANLHFKVLKKDHEDDKYIELRNLLQVKSCPSIVYVSRTKKAAELALQLTGDGFKALAFHGKMEKELKTANQNAFMGGQVDIIVATSAFGMGVDKDNVGLIIHYDISDSLENYIQEAGRAGRKESVSADCYILFKEEDLDRHFVRHNQNKMTAKEINQIWKAVKDLTQVRNNASYSALEIARKAGWDDSIRDIETRVTTAIAALEEARYLERGKNYPSVFANSILCKNAEEAIGRINASEKFRGDQPEALQKERAIRIVKKLFSSKSKRLSTDEIAESRIDYLADQLELKRDGIIRLVTILKDERILADTKDLTAFVKKGESGSQSSIVAAQYMALEKELFHLIAEETGSYNLKELNARIEAMGGPEIPDCSPKKIRTIINFWAIKKFIVRRHHDRSGNYLQIVYDPSRNVFPEKMTRRHYLAHFIIRYLFQKANEDLPRAEAGDSMLIEFSVLELKQEAEKEQGLFAGNFSNEDVEDALFYLSRIDAIKIDGGFLVIYNRLSIDRQEKNNRVQYKSADYEKLSQHYLQKVQQIHIVGEYARKMIRDYKEALQFVDDYFNLQYPAFLTKYFPGARQDEIRRTLTPEKFSRLFGDLSPAQLDIIKDYDHRIIVVAAGPGSGKTKILVHKLASLLLAEDVKYEQLLMLTFSRAAATEFKDRLLELIGNPAREVEIKTFHSYCFDLLGRIGNIDQSDEIITATVRKMQNNEIEKNKITKTVLVIDEAQDMDAAQYELVQALIEQNEDMRVILVGDDDQNIFTFRGADARFMQAFTVKPGAFLYQLTENHRSGSHIVTFANRWVSRITQRLKTVPGLSARSEPGIISITAYLSPHLIIPVSTAINKAALHGSTGVLVYANEDATKLMALLRQHGKKVRLIQTNEYFSLANLYELRAFSDLLKLDDKVPHISETAWKQALNQFVVAFHQSTKQELALAVIRQFAAVNHERKYKSDWNTFLIESRIEDFVDSDAETIYVSTIHKAKGKQFDNVFVLLNDFDPSTDENKRLLYVAVTRAKNRLSIHYKGDYLAPFQSGDLTYESDENDYPEPPKLPFFLTHRDVNLGHFKNVQYDIRHLYSGTPLMPCEEGLSNTEGKLIVKFSMSFKGILAKWLRKGYRLSQAQVNFVVCWKEQGDDQEYRILLPEIILARG